MSTSCFPRPLFQELKNFVDSFQKKLYRSEEQVLREFAINLLFYFSQADPGVARTIALQDTMVSLNNESNALIDAQQHGVNALRDNPTQWGQVWI